MTKYLSPIILIALGGLGYYYGNKRMVEGGGFIDQTPQIIKAFGIIFIIVGIVMAIRKSK